MEITKFHFNRKDTAMMMGVTVVSFGQWKIEWDLKKGNSVYYDIRKVIAFRLARDTKPKVDLTSERARLAKNQADKSEHELSILKGETIPIPEVGLHWQGMIMAMRAKLLSLPSKIAIVALEASSLTEIEEAATDLMYEALDEINKDGIPPKATPDDYRNTGVAATTTKPNSKPVGRPASKTKPRGKRRARPMANQ